MGYLLIILFYFLIKSCHDSISNSMQMLHVLLWIRSEIIITTYFQFHILVNIVPYTNRIAFREAAIISLLIHKSTCNICIEFEMDSYYTLRTPSRSSIIRISIICYYMEHMPGSIYTKTLYSYSPTTPSKLELI